MKIRFKFFLITIFLFLFNNLYCYEIIRDPIFEDYFADISEELRLKKINVYLVKNSSANAFVVNDNIYFTIGLLRKLNNEDTLKAIYLHEYAHVERNHSESKRINIIQSNKKNIFYNLFSLGIATISGNTSVGLGTSITLNSSLINNISKHSVDFEIEADNFMTHHIKKNKISTFELITFLNNTDEKSNYYFRTHPRTSERVNSLKDFNFKINDNSKKFEWIKSKYSKNSNNKYFNLFFKNLENGIYNQKETLKDINEHLIHYEAFKKGLFVENWNINFQNFLKNNSNSFLKIEFINFLLDNDLNDKYYIIEDLKFNKQIMNEYFYNYIYGKYYNKIGKFNLSNFYFCQFYRVINSINKADFFCKKYDIKDIPTLDKSYALFK